MRIRRVDKQIIPLLNKGTINSKAFNNDGVMFIFNVSSASAKQTVNLSNKILNNYKIDLKINNCHSPFV
jgi:hypothetical protein